MAHGENARKSNREWESRRSWGYSEPGPITKDFTHRRERREARKIEREARCETTD